MIAFTINGRDVQVDAAGDTPLLWVIREHLGLTGTKYGCLIAQCGCCTVHLNGAPIRSCIMPVSVAAGAHVTTIEGLSAGGQHKVQKAWIDFQVPQCGYCQPGQMMEAAALLARNPHPSRAEIVDAMNGHLCRCGTYLRILRAIESLAVPAAHGDG